MSKKTINIFSSCDGNYIRHIPTLLMSIHDNMSPYHIRFFFLHTNIDKEELNPIYKFCQTIGIDFSDIRMSSEKIEKYRKLRELTVFTSDRPFSLEGMFICLPNIDLPSDVDRALYLDAGDIILSGDISEFYFSDFNGNLINASKGFGDNWQYTAENLYDVKSFSEISSEYFNSGSVLFNVNLMRSLNIDFDYYYSFLKTIRYYTPEYTSIYMPGRSFVVTDDQGLLSSAFVGNIQFYDPKGLGATITPYNFRPYLLELHKDENPQIKNLTLNSVDPRIIHYIGNKPWTPADKRKSLLKISQESLALWDKYEKMAEQLMGGQK